MPCREVSFLRTANKKLQEQAALKGQKRGRNTEPFHRRILRDIDKGAEIRSQTVKNVQSSLLSGWEGRTVPCRTHGQSFPPLTRSSFIPSSSSSFFSSPLSSFFAIRRGRRSRRHRRLPLPLPHSHAPYLVISDNRVAASKA